MEDMAQELQGYEHLQHLNLAKNGLRDISQMAHLLHLLTVNVSNNAIGSIKFLEELGSSDRLQFLQVSFFSNIVTVASFCLTAIRCECQQDQGDASDPLAQAILA